jgi:hypothetical protein
MSFPIDDKELKAAYYHLKDFGQEEHARAVLEFAEQTKMMADRYLRLKRRLMEVEEVQPGASYEEVRNKDLERRVRNRPAANE